MDFKFDDDQGHIFNETRKAVQPMLTTAQVLNRPTVSIVIRNHFANWIAGKLRSTFLSSSTLDCKHIDEQRVLYHPIFESIQKIMHEEMLEQWPELSTSRLLKTIIDISNHCYSDKHPTLALTALQSLRHVYHQPYIRDHIAAQVVSSASSCLMKTDILNELVQAINYDEQKQSSHRWPRFGVVPLIDVYVIDQFFNVIDRNSSVLDCNRAPIYDYLKKKRGKEFEMLFEKVALQRYSSMKRRYRRQSLGGLGGFGGSDSSNSAGGGGFTPNLAVECERWDIDFVNTNLSTWRDTMVPRVAYDMVMFPVDKQHCLFTLELELGGFLTLSAKSVFFSGKNVSSRVGRLYGRMGVSVSMILIDLPLFDLEFDRDLHKNGFRAYTSMALMDGDKMLEEYQDRCNMSYKLITQPLQYTVPAFQVSFGGFKFLMTADFALTVNLSINPSYCGADGEMGGRIYPIVVAEATAYAELENDASFYFYYFYKFPSLFIGRGWGRGVFSKLGISVLTSVGNWLDYSLIFISVFRYWDPSNC